MVTIGDGERALPPQSDSVMSWIYSASTIGNDIPTIVEQYRTFDTAYLMTVPVDCDAHGRVPNHRVAKNTLLTDVLSGGIKSTYRDRIYSEQELDGLGRVVPIGRLALAGYWLVGAEVPSVSVYSPNLLGWVGLFSIPKFEAKVEWSAQSLLTSYAPCVRWVGRAMAYASLPIEARYAARTMECVLHNMSAVPQSATYDAIDGNDFRVAVSGHAFSQYVLSRALGFPRQAHLAIRRSNLSGRRSPRIFPLLEERGNVSVSGHWHSAIDDIMAYYVAIRMTGESVDAISGDLNLILTMAERYPKYLLESELAGGDGREPATTTIERVRQLVRGSVVS
jgi:hypothetical protein